MTARYATICAALLCSALGLGSCAVGTSEIAFAPAPPPPQGAGLVYLFRPDRAADPFSAPAVRIDGKPVGKLHASEYIAIHLPAGRHIASLEPEGYPPSPQARALDFLVEPGQVGALALGFIRAPLSRPGVTIETKRGEVEIPSSAHVPSSDGPYFWRYIPAIEANPLNAELRQRNLSPAAAPDLAAR